MKGFHFGERIMMSSVSWRIFGEQVRVECV